MAMNTSSEAQGLPVSTALTFAPASLAMCRATASKSVTCIFTQETTATTRYQKKDPRDAQRRH